MSVKLKKTIQIGAFRFYPSRNQLASIHRTVHLTPKTSQVLMQLIRRSGQTVKREQLITAVWKNDFASDELLTRAITDLRKAFGDRYKQPEYIETIPKVGYRLIADIAVEPAAEEPGTPQTDPPEQQTTTRPARRNALYAIALLLAAALIAAYFLRSKANQPKPETVVVNAANFPVDYQLVPLNAGHWFAESPTISADGSYLAFVDTTDGKQSIHVSLAEGSWSVRITPNDGADYAHAAISPGGEFLVVSRISSNDCGTYTMPIIGSMLYERFGTCDPEYPYTDWSADGNMIAYTQPGRDDQPATILVASDQGETLHQLPSGPAQLQSAYRPRFSHDSRQLAFFQTSRSGEQAIAIHDFQSGMTRLLITLRHRGLSLDWAPDDQRILVAVQDDDGDSHLIMIDPETGQRVPVADTQGVVDLNVSSTSGSVALIRRVLEQSIWRVPAHPAEAGPELLIDSNLSDHSPAISPDRSTLAYVSNRSGSDQLWLRDLGTAEDRQATNSSISKLSKPRWSPDGAYILFSAHNAVSSDLYLYSLASGESQLLALSSVTQSAAGHWRQDSEHIAFFCQLDGGEAWNLCETSIGIPGRINIIRQNLEVPAQYAYTYEPEQQQEWLFFTDSDTGSLHRLDYRSGELAQVDFGDAERARPIQVLESFGNQLLIGRESGSGLNIDFQVAAAALAPNAPQTVASLSVNDTHFSTDGEYIYLTRQSVASQRLDLMMPSEASPVN